MVADAADLPGAGFARRLRELADLFSRQGKGRTVTAFADLIGLHRNNLYRAFKDGKVTWAVAKRAAEVMRLEGDERDDFLWEWVAARNGDALITAYTKLSRYSDEEGQRTLRRIAVECQEEHEAEKGGNKREGRT